MARSSTDPLLAAEVFAGGSSTRRRCPLTAKFARASEELSTYGFASQLCFGGPRGRFEIFRVDLCRGSV